jgi:hypothetical protein
MNDETTTNPMDETAQAPEDAAKAAAEGGESATTQIMNELSQLGHKVTAAVQTIWDSEERHKAEEEIRKALKMAGERIDHVAEDLRKSDVTKDVQSQATRAAEAVQKSEVTRQVREGLLTGLRRINEELSEFLDKSKAEQAAKSAGEAAADAGKAAAEAGEAAAEAASAVVNEAADKVKNA